MVIKDLNEKDTISNDNKTAKAYHQFRELLNELRKRELPEKSIILINENIDPVNQSTLTGRPLAKLIKQKQTAILKHIEKELKLVPKHHYRTMWMLLGFTTFGLPIGAMFGLSIGNIGLLGVGMPIGMAIGMAFGSSMDKKAFTEGRQLNIEIKN